MIDKQATSCQSLGTKMLDMTQLALKILDSHLAIKSMANILRAKSFDEASDRESGGTTVVLNAEKRNAEAWPGLFSSFC